MAGGGVTSGSFPWMRVPFATSANTLLTVSSVRVEFRCNFLVACIAVVARRKRFVILSPASYTSSDRMIFLNFRCGAFRAEARLDFHLTRAHLEFAAFGAGFVQRIEEGRRSKENGLSIASLLSIR
jgi:hypothetical protein